MSSEMVVDEMISPRHARAILGISTGNTEMIL